MASSNLADSYEKVVLVVALLIALGLGYLAYSKMGKVQDDFVPPPPVVSPAPPLPGKPKMDEAAKQLVNPVALPPAQVGGRKVDTFVGIPWFLKQDETTTVDLGNPEEPPVHEGIPNQWWLENGINPGYADSPQQDADNDGFSNREEFEAETDPTLASSHPPLINKVRVAELLNDRFQLDFSGDDFAGKYKLKFFTERETGGVLEQKMDNFIPAGEGDESIFFQDPPAQFRFRLKAVEERKVMNERTGVERNEKFAIIEDLKPNLRDGPPYEVPYSGRGVVFDDHTAVLYLDAIGEEGNKFEVPVNTRFTLPHDPAAADKPFLFKEVSKVGDVIIEWEEDGQTKFVSLQVPK